MTPRKERALVALIQSPTRAAAAKRAGIAERTLRDYCRDPEFSERYQNEQAALMESAIGAARARMGEAAAVLGSLMLDDSIPAQTRVNAANAILTHGLRLTERADVTERINHLESLLTAAEVS